MSAREKSDLPEVAEKRANKAASAAAELVERRGGAKENAELQSTVRTQSREAVSQAQARIREAVNRNRQDKLTALLHHLTIDVLRASFFGLKKSAAPGVDEMTWTEYAEGLEENLSDLHSRVQTGAYRALPSRRTYIPKADGRQRPLGIAALEDKIVQAAVVAILTPIYEAEFLGFSYGFRPKRSQHQALDALAFGIGRRRINWVLDCDVQSFFDKVSQSWLIRFIEHRIGDRRIIRLIAKWLTAGVLEGGHLMVTEEGTPQGAVISPLLANIYLHYVYDLWAHQWRQRCATGDVIVVRYADDMFSSRPRSTSNGRNLVDRAKPFDIPKREVWEAYKRVRANHGTAGVDGESIADFEADLSNNLYKLWNRLSSGSYHPPPVRRVDIPKGDGRGGTRPLGIPTVADRIAQTVVKRQLEPLVEPCFHQDSYGYRPGKSALDAVGVARQRCWRHAWVLDLDIQSFLIEIDSNLLMRAVRKHTDCPWVLLYIERWLKAPYRWRMGASSRGERNATGGVISRSCRISFCITRSTSGCCGTIRPSRSSVMPTM